MRSSLIYTAFASLVSLAYSSSPSADFLIGRGVDGLDDLIDDNAILQAFTDAGHHDALFPKQTWENNEGKTYQTLYDFDADEWRAMRSSLFEKAGLNETDSSYVIRRQSEDDAPVFFCYNRDTRPVVSLGFIHVEERRLVLIACFQAYTASLGAAVNAVCSGFAFGAERINRVQTIQRNIQVSDAARAPAWPLSYRARKWFPDVLLIVSLLVRRVSRVAHFARPSPIPTTSPSGV